MSNIACPDRPTLKQVARTTVRGIMYRLMVQVCGAGRGPADPDALTNEDVLLLQVATDGIEKWRRVVGREIGGFFDGNRSRIDDLANDMFVNGVMRRARERFPLNVFPSGNYTRILDSVEEHSPPTEAEIEDSWEVDIGSSEQAMSRHWEGSARHRKGSDLGDKKH